MAEVRELQRAGRERAPATREADVDLDEAPPPSAHRSYLGGLRQAPGDAVASVRPGGRVKVPGGELGPFRGEAEGRPRAEVIAERLNHARAFEGTTATQGADHAWVVRLPDGAEFTVSEADASAAGIVTPRLAAHRFASTLSGRPVPAEVQRGPQPKGHVSATEGDTLAMHRTRASAIVAQGTNIVAAGIQVGPFADATRAAELALPLQGLAPSALRSARAEGATVVIADRTLTLTAADARALGAKKVEDAARGVAERLDGTWAKGVHDQAGRRVMPAQLSPGALFELARAIAEGPGRAAVSTEPGQVTVVGLRGVNRAGVYDPALGAADDLIIPLVIDTQGRRVALRLSGTVDPGGTRGGGATQVGDATQAFAYSNFSGNPSLKGTPLLRPEDPGIEGRAVGGKLASYEGLKTKVSPQGGTLIHFGTDAEQSRGCSIVLDAGSFRENKATLTRLFDRGMQKLPREDLARDAEGVARALAAARAAPKPDKTRITRLEALHELRQLEAGMIARDGGDVEGEARAKRALAPPPKAPKRGGKNTKEAAAEAPATTPAVPLESLASVPNYKAFLSLVLRDPDLRVTYVIVDGSKVPPYEGPETPAA